MTEDEFAADLRAEGYSEILTQQLEPRPASGEHGHGYAIKGLVLDGLFTVIQRGERHPCGPGQMFFVAEGDPHDEEIGPDGARVLIGRRYAAA